MTDGEPRARVVVVQQSLRAYRVAFFEALRTRLRAEGVSLELIHSNVPRSRDRRNRGELPWAEHVPSWPAVIGRGRVCWQPVLRRVWGADLVVVEQALRLLVNFPLLFGQRIGGPPVAMWGHGRDPWRPDAAQRMRRWFSLRPHWWFAYTEDVARTVAGWGFPRDRITAVRNTRDVAALSRAVDAVTPDEVRRTRDELGIRGDRIGVFVGHLRPSKGLDFLLAAGEQVRRRVPDFQLVFVGFGEGAARIAARAHRSDWVRFAGFRADHDLAVLLRLADALLVPVWVGLVAVDSFAAGVPLVASASARHPPEFGYLEDGVNSVIVDDGGDPRVYGDAVADLLLDTARRRTLAEACRREAPDYHLDVMVENFTDGVLRALDVSRRERSR